MKRDRRFTAHLCPIEPAFPESRFTSQGEHVHFVELLGQDLEEDLIFGLV
jgi:hypothetical protein